MKKGCCASVCWRDLGGLSRTRLAGIGCRWVLALGRNRVLPPGKLPGSPCASPTFPALPLGTWVAGLALAGAGGPAASPGPGMHGAPLTSLAPRAWACGVGCCRSWLAGRGACCQVLPVSRGVWASLSLGLSCLLGAEEPHWEKAGQHPPPGRQGWRGSATGGRGRLRRGPVMHFIEDLRSCPNHPPPPLLPGLPGPARRSSRAGEDRAIPELLY